MKRKKSLIVIGVLAVLALVIWASLRDSGPRGTEVEVQATKLRTISSRVKATGEITPDALKVFHFAGINSLDAHKLLVIRLGSRSGLPQGKYLVNYFGVELKIVSQGKSVSVFDPYFPP